MTDDTRPLTPQERRRVTCEQCGVMLTRINRIAASNDVSRAWWVADRVLCTQCAPTYPPLPAALAGADPDWRALAVAWQARAEALEAVARAAVAYVAKVQAIIESYDADAVHINDPEWAALTAAIAALEGRDDG